MDNPTNLCDSDLMALAICAMYEDGEAPKAVLEELADRLFSEDDIEDEYSRFLAMRATERREASREYWETYGVEGVA